MMFDEQPVVEEVVQQSHRAPGCVGKPAKTDGPRFRYFDANRHWTGKIEPHCTNSLLNEVLVTDFNKFVSGRWGLTFQHGQYPSDFDFDREKHRGSLPRFWRYVNPSANHWLANFNLVLAQLALPEHKWRIVGSDLHSTVWDGRRTIFDLNFQALQIPAELCFNLASKDDTSEELSPGELMATSPPPNVDEEFAALSSWLGD